MLSDQVGEAKGMGVALPVLLHLLPQRRDILRVFEDGDPKRCLVGGDPLETFKEFVPLEEDPTLSEEQIGQDGCPGGVGVEHGTGIPVVGGAAVQKRLGARFGLSLGNGTPVGVNDDEIAILQVSLILSAGGHQQAKRVSLQHDAVIAGGTQRPASLPALVTYLLKSGDLMSEGGQVFGKRLVHGDLWGCLRDSFGGSRMGRTKTVAFNCACELEASLWR
jgi:hypothetical protein